MNYRYLTDHQGSSQPQSRVGKSSTFLIFSSNFDQFFLTFLKLYLFSSSFRPSGWANREGSGSVAAPEIFFVVGHRGGKMRFWGAKNQKKLPKMADFGHFSGGGASGGRAPDWGMSPWCRHCSGYATADHDHSWCHDKNYPLNVWRNS